MAIILKNSLFIHVPKCAGRTITNCILKNVQKSKVLGDPVYDSHSRVTMGFLPTIGFIRKPLPFLVSLWSHRKRKKNNIDGTTWNWQDYLRLERDCKSENLEEFLLNVSKQKNLVWDYYMFYLGGHRNLTLGTIENLENDLINFLIINNEKFNIRELKNDLINKIGDSKTEALINDISKSLANKIIEAEPILSKIYGLS